MKKSLPLDIIIAENMRDAADFIYRELKPHMPENYPVNELVGLVETSIGKMVPIMSQKDVEEDILQVFAEPYNTLILDKMAFKNPVPEAEGLAPKENMKAWVDRKSFIHNLGHATTAYLGYLHNPAFTYIYEVLEVDELFLDVKGTMTEAAGILLKKYPEVFSAGHLIEHIDDLMTRFSNRSLGDSIYRVGLDVRRKLGPDDRLIGAIKMARDLNMPYQKILYAAVAGSFFKSKDEKGNLFSEDKGFHQKYNGNLVQIFREVCGFDEVQDHDIFDQVAILSEIIQKRFKPLNYEQIS